MTHTEIANISGLPRSTVISLSKRTTWTGVSIEVIDKFSMACGVDLMHMKRQMEFVRRRKMKHLATGTPNQRKFYAELMKLLNARDPA